MQEIMRIYLHTYVFTYYSLHCFPTKFKTIVYTIYSVLIHRKHANHVQQNTLLVWSYDEYVDESQDDDDDVEQNNLEHDENPLEKNKALNRKNPLTKVVFHYAKFFGLHVIERNWQPKSI